jgi:hypothetical protein
LLSTDATDPAQLNNPAGGILRGGDAIAELHRRVFSSPANVRVTFSDVIAYLGDRHAVFAGRETGSYSAPDGTSMPLEIRTSRYFRYKDRQCRQYHHHGSIDDPDASAPNSAPSAPDAQSLTQSAASGRLGAFLDRGADRRERHRRGDVRGGGELVMNQPGGFTSSGGRIVSVITRQVFSNL